MRFQNKIVVFITFALKCCNSLQDFTDATIHRMDAPNDALVHSSNRKLADPSFKFKFYYSEDERYIGQQAAFNYLQELSNSPLRGQDTTSRTFNTRVKRYPSMGKNEKCTANLANKRICFNSQDKSNRYRTKDTTAKFTMVVSTNYADLTSANVNATLLEQFMFDAAFGIYKKMKIGHIATARKGMETSYSTNPDVGCSKVIGGGKVHKNCKRRCRQGHCYQHCTSTYSKGCNGSLPVYRVPQFAIMEVEKNDFLIATLRIEINNYQVTSGPNNVIIRTPGCHYGVSLGLGFLSLIPVVGPLFGVAGIVHTTTCGLIDRRQVGEDEIVLPDTLELVPRDFAYQVGMDVLGENSNLYDCSKCWPSNEANWYPIDDNDTVWYHDDIPELNKLQNYCQFCWEQQALLDKNPDWIYGMDSTCSSVNGTTTSHLKKIMPEEDRGAIVLAETTCSQRLAELDESNSGLSKGAVSGISFASGAAVVAGVAGFVFLRNQQKKKEDDVLSSFKVEA